MNDVIDIACSLIRIPSVSGSDGEVAVQHHLADWMRGEGYDVDFWDVDLDAVMAHPRFPGVEVPRKEAWGLVGRWGGAEGPTLILNGHVDVVPPGAQWSSDPFEPLVDSGWLWGRGACDMKGGLACCLAAVQRLRKAGVKLRGSVLVQPVIGEEDGGLGTFATLLRGHRGDAAIVPEPTRLAVITACAGALCFRVHVTGRSAHASVREEGVSALEKWWPIGQAIQALEEARNERIPSLLAHCAVPYAINIGTVRAGEWPSSVPESLVAEGRFGVALGESLDDARATLEAAVRAACENDAWLRAHPARVEWFGGVFESAETPSDDPVARLVWDAHAAVTGGPPRLHGAPYGSDLRLLQRFGGVPTVLYGPGDVREAHIADERVQVSDLETATRVLEACIVRFCGVVP